MVSVPWSSSLEQGVHIEEQRESNLFKEGTCQAGSLYFKLEMAFWKQML